MKPQAVRALDVLGLGPLLILAGARRQLGPLTRLALLVSGIGTIAYNLDNYRKQRAQELALQRAMQPPPAPPASGVTPLPGATAWQPPRLTEF